MRIKICLLIPLCFLAACSGTDANEQNFPKGAKEERRLSRGSLTGDGGLFSLGGNDNAADSGGGSLNVNGFLWRATLDTLSFMPLASADPFGGTIITEWYEDPKTPGERYKVNAVILDKSLRADGVRVTVFKQRADKTGWRDLPQDERLSRKLEDTILTRARQLRIDQLGR